MASLSAQVTYKTGDLTSYATQMLVWLDDAVREVTDRCIVINPEYERYFVSAVTFTTSAGTPIESARVLSVFRRDTASKMIPAPLVDIGKVQQASSSGSIYSATEAFPISYINNGTLFTYPTPTYAVAYVIAYGTVNDGAGTISDFPASLTELVVLRAAISATEYRIATLRDEMRTYINTDEDIELANAKQAEIAKAEALLSRLAQEYAAGFERVKR